MAKTNEYQQTLNLPTTDFPMRANLSELEPRIQQFWEEIDLYQAVQEHGRGQPKFILHDGPPFSNGDIHLGQALNKILKDVLVKYQTMRGFDVPVRAGVGQPRAADGDPRDPDLRDRPPRDRSDGAAGALGGDGPALRGRAAGAVPAPGRARRLGAPVPHDGPGVRGGGARALPEVRGAEVRVPAG